MNGFFAAPYLESLALARSDAEWSLFQSPLLLHVPALHDEPIAELPLEHSHVHPTQLVLLMPMLSQLGLAQTKKDGLG